MPTAAATEIVEIRNRFTDAVIFTAGVEVGLATVGLKLGAAVRIAIEAQANLHGASLPGANLHGANLRGADLSGANLHWADLIHADLSDANLTRADLINANLHWADLNNANLSGANLSVATLSGANMTSANLRGAGMHGANMTGAVLINAFMHGANLSGATLSGANLLGADLRGADLKGAHGALDCGAPHGWRIVVVLHDDGIRIAAGCRWLTFSAAVDHWRNRDDRKLMPPLLAYIRAACAINGWPLDEDRLVEG